MQQHSRVCSSRVIAESVLVVSPILLSVTVRVDTHCADVRKALDLPFLDDQEGAAGSARNRTSSRLSAECGECLAFVGQVRYSALASGGSCARSSLPSFRLFGIVALWRPSASRTPWSSNPVASAASAKYLTCGGQKMRQTASRKRSKRSPTTKETTKPRMAREDPSEKELSRNCEKIFRQKCSIIFGKAIMCWTLIDACVQVS